LWDKVKELTSGNKVIITRNNKTKEKMDIKVVEDSL